MVRYGCSLSNRQLLIILLFIVAGILAGVSAGLLGADGGTVVVPLLAIIFLHNAVPITTAMYTAVGTSLAIMIITTIGLMFVHVKKKWLRWDLFFRLLLGITVGAAVGALVAHALPGELLH